MWKPDSLPALFHRLRTQKGLLLPNIKRFSSLSIDGKLTLAFGILIGFTFLVVALNFFAGLNAIRNINVTQRVRGPTTLTSAEAQASLLRMQLHMRGYLVLSDPQDKKQYEVYKKLFETNLGALKSISREWRESEDIERLAKLENIYTEWAKLPPKLFALHDSPLNNRPAFRLARVDVESLRNQVINETNDIIKILDAQEPSFKNRELRADLVHFQTSFDAMVANLIAFGTSGEKNFKLAYGSRIGTNNAVWRRLLGKQHLLTDKQRDSLDTIAEAQVEINDMAVKIFDVAAGERTYEDLFLYRSQVVPQANRMLGLLAEITAGQQALFREDLKGARDRLISACHRSP